MKTFGPAYPEGYPAEMRRQLWPLCCGASIISGFKSVGNLSNEELVKQIESTINDYIPDLQVFKGEMMQPALTFLTLNQGQWQSKKITDAITKAGFVFIGAANPRGGEQRFYVRDTSKTWRQEAVKVA